MTGRMGRDIGPITEELRDLLREHLGSAGAGYMVMDCIVRLIDAKIAEHDEAVRREISSRTDPRLLHGEGPNVRY